jgi:predicted aspartyl protease
LFIFDSKNKLNLLIDTGAEVTVIPKTTLDQKIQIDRRLFAANGTPINTYGEKLINFNIGLCRDLKWLVIIADVTHPIIGADFLEHYGLLVDLKNKQLLDPLKSLSVRGTVRQTDVCSLSTYNQKD